MSHRIRVIPPDIYYNIKYNLGIQVGGGMQLIAAREMKLIAILCHAVFFKGLPPPLFTAVVLAFALYSKKTLDDPYIKLDSS